MKKGGVFWLGTSLIFSLYLATHLWALTALPVFADEAIYLRWSQLMIDDWSRYAFFPLNDGKTPLQMWLAIPFLQTFADPLWAGRFLVVVAGAAQVAAVGYLTKLLGGRDKAVWLAMLWTTVLPFWFFHHRMALLDGLLTLWLSISLIGVVRLTRTRVWQVTHADVVWPVVLTGVSFGLALLTKLPAILFAPALALTALFPPSPLPKSLPTPPQTRSLATRIRLLAATAAAILLGLVIFFSLKLHPAFGQLFNRGGDFLYPWKVVVFGGKWRDTLGNLPTYISYFGAYLTWPVLFFALAGLFSPIRQRTHHLLVWSALAFAGPIMVLGLVVYPRYLLPASLFLTTAAALSVQDLLDRFVTRQKSLLARSVIGLLIVVFLANGLAQSGLFIWWALTDADRIPFVAADHIQYHHEWSSGHGIREATQLIQNLARDHTVAVGTEGYYGTLPDGILLYLHNQDVSNIYVDGIGYPIKAIPETFAQRARAYQQTLVVVNSHRRELPTEKLQLLATYCRPDGAPCLEVWNVTEFIRSSSTDNQNRG